jgi:hypothetical protein
MSWATSTRTRRDDLADGQVEDPEDEANTRLIGPWKRKPPPRPKQG